MCARVCEGLSKAETQALNNYGSGEDENEEEEVEEFEASSVEVQTSLQATDNTAEHSQVCVYFPHRFYKLMLKLVFMFTNMT